MKVKNLIDFVMPEYLKGVDWERMREELKLPSEQFWGLQWLRQRRAEKQAYANFLHRVYIEAGYKHREKKGVHYYWKEKEIKK